MAARKHPLELIFRAHGPVELLNADEQMLWVSESDDDFKEEFTDEFLHEEDAEDILEYLHDNNLLTQMEFNAFSSDRWDIIVETVDTGTQSDPDDDDDNEEDWECDLEEDDDESDKMY
jgi:predicted dithiol-disulfide oxidoreductase (DUF899 family)